MALINPTDERNKQYDLARRVTSHRVPQGVFLLYTRNC